MAVSNADASDRSSSIQWNHMGEPLVYLVVPGIGPLGLTSAALREARARGLDLLGDAEVAPALTAETSNEAQLVTTKSLAKTLSLPTSCLYEYARSGRIPSVRVGKHVRFRISDVLAALQNTGAPGKP